MTPREKEEAEGGGGGRGRQERAPIKLRLVQCLISDPVKYSI